MKGRIVKIGGGKFSVLTEEGVAEYSAKGNIRIRGDGLVTGDIVEIENGVVIRTEKRKNRLYRPNVCNVDVVNIVVSDPPKPDFYLVDKLISKCFFENVPCVVTVNKIDRGEDVARAVEENFGKAVGKIFQVSARTGKGAEELLSFLKGKVTVFTGQSAVGKTSLCNRLFGENRRVGELSGKTERGKQTTTASEIILADGVCVVDTPGFTSIDVGLNAEDLPHSYPEFIHYLGQCRFKDCRHDREPGCAVKSAADNGEIPLLRYKRYLEILSDRKLRERI